MALPVWDPLHDLARTALGGAGVRAATAIATVVLAVVATGFLVSAGFVLLMREIGVPATALTFAGLFAIAALIVHLLARAASARRARRVKAARTRAETDILRAAAFGRSTLPLAPLAAFIAAFVLARRS